MKIVKRVAALAGIAVAVTAPTIIASTPAFASSGMTCTTAYDSNGIWFYCHGTKNVNRPWTSVNCVSVLTNSSWPLKDTKSGTEFAPFSFSDYMSCGNGNVVITSDPNWGPR